MQEEKKTDKKIVIHVTGSVKNEGIVKVDNNSRIADIIEEAGGVTDDADLSKINLAYIVEDGQKIYVPSIDDKGDIKTVENSAGEKVIEGNTNEKDISKSM